jgi:hypothetical protein
MPIKPVMMSQVSPEILPDKPEMLPDKPEMLPDLPEMLPGAPEMFPAMLLEAPEMLPASAAEDIAKVMTDAQRIDWKRFILFLLVSGD